MNGVSASHTLIEEPTMATVLPLSPIGLLAVLVLRLGEVTVYEHA
jgi:hypothetical protein